MHKDSPEIGDASAYYDLGCELFQAERHKEALLAFEHAQKIDSECPEVRNRIIEAHLGLGNYAIAFELAAALVRAKPRDANAWTNLSAAAYRCREWDSALSAAQRAFDLDSKTPHHVYNLALIMGELRRFKRARHLMERVVQLAPDDPKYRYALSLVQLADGDYAQGWKNAEARWHTSKVFSQMVNTPAPRWRGESLEKKNLLVLPEQGIGDCILALRYVPRLTERARKENGLILLCCWGSLYTLFARSLTQYCDVLYMTTQEKGMVLQPGQFMGREPCVTTAMSLPLWLGGAIPDTFPYLTPDPAKVDAWRKILSGDNNRKVGLAWTGRDDHRRNDLRSLPIFELMTHLKDVPDVTFYSLQQSHPDQAREAGLIDFTPELTSIEDTAALLCALDLVISADVMVAHLCGALDVSLWVAADSGTYYGWGRTGQRSSWYPNAKVYRQQRMHRWKEVFEEIRRDLNCFRNAN